MATYFFGGGKWRAGGGDGIKNPSLSETESETDFPSLIATDYKIRRPAWKKIFEPSPFRRCV